MKKIIFILLALITFNLSAQIKKDFEGIWEPPNNTSSFYLLIDYVEETDSIRIVHFSFSDNAKLDTKIILNSDTQIIEKIVNPDNDNWTVFKDYKLINGYYLEATYTGDIESTITYKRIRG